MSDVRRHAWYSGEVQGVGFRYATRRLAQERRVTGFVKNLSDGQVELVAEGPADEVEGLLSDVASAMSGCIRDARVVDEPPTGAFDRFGVAF